jgi:DNA-binding NarL/FixJ family response regulator
MIRVLVVDDHHVVRSGLTTLLNTDPEIEVVADADNGLTAIAAVEAKRPDVILMDLSMPGMDGVEATAYLTTHVEGSKVVVLTSFADRERVQEAVAAGAIGYLLKDCEPAELLAAVRSAAAGHVPIDPRVAGALLPSGPSMTAEVVISPRETEVLRLVAQGMANKQVARALGITERTVKAHLSRVYREIGVLDRTSAALWARDHLPSL